MGLFELDIEDHPQRGIYAGGMKFRADREALERYFNPVLTYVSLNDLVGEAVFWMLLPWTLAIYLFPFLLFAKGLVFALLATLISYLLLELLHWFIYIKAINYLLFFFASPIPQIILYIIVGVLFYLSGSYLEIISLGVVLLFFRLGGGAILSSILFLPLYIIAGIYFRKTGYYLFLPNSDQVLRTIGFYYAKKNKIDPHTFKMFE